MGVEMGTSVLGGAKLLESALVAKIVLEWVAYLFNQTVDRLMKWFKNEILHNYCCPLDATALTSSSAMEK